MHRALSTLITLAGLCLLGAPAATALPVVPPGYYLVTFAAEVPNPTAMAFGPDGWLYVTRLDGTVTALVDDTGNGTADRSVTFASGFVTPLGLAHRNGQVYVTSRHKVTRLTDLDGDHEADVYEELVTNLPAGRHWTTGVAFGPDGDMYVGVGSSSNLGVQPHPWHATILRFTPDGQFIDIFARGLRNSYDLAFNWAGELFATDNGAGPDSLWSCVEAPDELNWIQAGGDYGFPDCAGVGDCAAVSGYCTPPPCGPGDCQFGGGCTPQMKSPIALLEPHSSSDGMVFGDGFEGFTKHDLFIAQFGQTEFIPTCPTAFGHRVIRTKVKRQGGAWKADPPEDFVTGLDLPLDVAVGPDGALYIAEFDMGIIRRVFQTGGPAAVQESPSPRDRPFGMSPNPALRWTGVAWNVEPPGRVAFDVFDVAGRRVAGFATLPGRSSPPRWDLTDGEGKRVPAGLYLVRAMVAGTPATARLIVRD